MKATSKFLLFAALAASLTALQSCAPAEGNNPGHEYMPDMGHSVAYEANLYDFYSYNRWGTDSAYYQYALARKPVAGTLPVGQYGLLLKSPEEQARLRATLSNYTLNGADRYAYGDNDEERLRAERELVNPLPITNAGLAAGENLYNINCGICHGEKGDGAGYLLRDDGGKYPAAPANFISDPFIAAKDGRYYHGIVYGKNVMGGYGDKLSLEERWEVIHYIRSLQAKAKGKVYDETSNTLDNLHKPAKGQATGTTAVAAISSPADSSKAANQK